MSHEDDEDRAVRAAIAMLSELAAWNRQRVEEGKKPVDIGVGLNTDAIVSGSIGSPKRMDFTVIGDGVNLASRLESACKQYKAHILMSEFTYKKLRGIYRIREVDRVIVIGKSEPVAVYEVLDYHTDETFPGMREALTHFRDGISRYRARNWDAAEAAFGEVLRLNPNDRPSQLYIERCQYFRAKPPGDDWDGVWVLESK
jgi:adenylate cyclase